MEESDFEQRPAPSGRSGQWRKRERETIKFLRIGRKTKSAHTKTLEKVIAFASAAVAAPSPSSIAFLDRLPRLPSSPSPTLRSLLDKARVAPSFRKLDISLSLLILRSSTASVFDFWWRKGGPRGEGPEDNHNAHTNMNMNMNMNTLCRRMSVLA